VSSQRLNGLYKYFARLSDGAVVRIVSHGDRPDDGEQIATPMASLAIKRPNTRYAMMSAEVFYLRAFAKNCARSSRACSRAAGLA
jgi:hypothetical protein